MDWGSDRAISSVDRVSDESIVNVQVKESLESVFNTFWWRFLTFLFMIDYDGG